MAMSGEELPWMLLSALALALASGEGLNSWPVICAQPLHLENQPCVFLQQLSCPTSSTWLHAGNRGAAACDMEVPCAACSWLLDRGRITETDRVRLMALRDARLDMLLRWLPVLLGCEQ